MIDSFRLALAMERVTGQDAYFSWSWQPEKTSQADFIERVLAVYAALTPQDVIDWRSSQDRMSK